MVDLFTVVLLVGLFLVLAITIPGYYLKATPKRPRSNYTILIAGIILASTLSVALITQVDYHYEHRASDSDWNYIALGIENLHNSTINISFDNTTDIIYAIDVKQCNPLDTFYFGDDPTVPLENFLLFDGHGFSFQHVNITLTSRLTSRIGVYGTNLNTTIRYSNEAELSDSLLISRATGIVRLSLDETCRQSDPDKGIDIRIHYAYLTLIDIDLPANTIGVLNFHESTTRTILHL
ncbi:MAG: hypothetical protein BAJATHORv1_100080, partial [Candidatus Thorarchaeota archaeon]